MSGELDRELQALRTEPVDARLGQLEPAVWKRIERIEETRSTTLGFLPVRAVAIAGALGLGITGGTFAAVAVAREQHEISVFSIDSRLAPSTLLDGRG